MVETYFFVLKWQLNHENEMNEPQKVNDDASRDILTLFHLRNIGPMLAQPVQIHWPNVGISSWPNVMLSGSSALAQRYVVR